MKAITMLEILQHSFKDLADVEHKDYLLTPHEVEAYARVDIPNDIRRYGVSPDLQAYARILSEKRMMETQQGITAYDILRFYHAPIDDYLDKWQEGIQ